MDAERWRRPQAIGSASGADLVLTVVSGATGVHVVSMRIAPIGRRAARAFVARHHSTHAAHVGEVWSDAVLDDDGDVCGVVVVGHPTAPALHGLALEVTRLAIARDAPPCAASRLLGATWRRAQIYGWRRLVSYIRIDEIGTCYRAAGWVPVAITRGREHTTGNRSGRTIQMFGERTTEIIDRVRWEIGPDAARSRMARIGDTWVTDLARHAEEC